MVNAPMRLTFAELSLTTLKALVQLHERSVVPAHWEQMQAPVTPHEQQQLQMLTAYLLNYQLNLMNEATILHILQYIVRRFTEPRQAPQQAAA